MAVINKYQTRSLNQEKKVMKINWFLALNDKEIKNK